MQSSVTRSKKIIEEVIWKRVLLIIKCRETHGTYGVWAVLMWLLKNTERAIDIIEIIKWTRYKELFINLTHKNRILNSFHATLKFINPMRVQRRRLIMRVACLFFQGWITTEDTRPFGGKSAKTSNSYSRKKYKKTFEAMHTRQKYLEAMTMRLLHVRGLESESEHPTTYIDIHTQTTIWIPNSGYINIHVIQSDRKPVHLPANANKRIVR